LLGDSLKPINNQVKIRFLVDWGELEAFGNDGQYSYAENFKFTPSNSLVSMIANGNVTLVSARYSTVNRTWEGTANNSFIDDTDPLNNCVGSWNAFSDEGGYYNYNGRWSNTTGNYIEYAFTGTQISWYALKNNDLGMATVYIDGELAADDIDCYSPIRIVQQLFTKSGLSNDNHIIKVVVKGTKNPASNGVALVHDYFGFIGTPTTPSIADDASVETTYNGTWVSDVNEIYFNSTCHVSNTINSDFQYSFTGTQVFWYGLKNDDLGMATVYIDGVLAADNIDCYSITKTVSILFSKTDLPKGNHTIKVVVKGIKNSASQGTTIVHDYFDFPEVSPVIIDDFSGSNTYGGDWLPIPSEDDYYNRTCHVATSAGSFVQATFTGTQISWYALKNDDLGMATIYIDGVLVQDDIDCYGSRAVYMLFSKDGLSNGIHTIKVVTKGTKNDSSKGIALVHDYFSVFVPNSPAVQTSGNLTFGNTEQNSTATKILTISNTSIATLAISSIDMPTGFSADWTSGDIAVNAVKEVTVTFAPTEVKAYGGMIKIHSNAVNDSVAVSGIGTVNTSVDEISGIKISISPNPLKNLLTVVSIDLCYIKISDISGKVIINKEMNSTTTTIDMSDYPKGIYIIKASTTNGGTLVRKIVKN
nr:T9SS type A sorting domain-containing protein [Bacteroidales bacterium]